MISNQNSLNGSGIRVVERVSGKEVTPGIFLSGSNIIPRDVIAFDDENQAVFNGIPDLLFQQFSYSNRHRQINPRCLVALPPGLCPSLEHQLTE